MTESDVSLRIALLTYRGNPYSGGQGVYVRHLSGALADLGHRVTVFSGQPYPQLPAGVDLEPLPSLDLYRADDPFRVPRLNEFRDGIDALEFATMCIAGFPEPLTFSLRAARALGRRRGEFDVIHDNQSLGYGLLGPLRDGVPLLATIHHPCSIDRDLALPHARDWKQRLSLKRWYAFTRMQGRVARRLPEIVTVSAAAKNDIVAQYRVDPSRVSVVANGVDTELFAPLESVPRVPGRLVSTASADAPLKGLVILIEALAKLRTERDAHLVVVGTTNPNGAVRSAIERFGLEGCVSFRPGISDLELGDLYRGAEVAVVPSLYEGFSLPAIEAMASGTPVVATDAGALPEVVGEHEHSALIAPAGDAGALAHEIGRLLDDPLLRRHLASAGRERVLQRFTWVAAAKSTVERYRAVITKC